MSDYTFQDYKTLRELYIKQMEKTDNLQRENIVLYNRVLELQQTVDNHEVKAENAL